MRTATQIGHKAGARGLKRIALAVLGVLLMAALARTLRASADGDDDVDLGGYGASQIQELFTAAFKEPIVASKMIGFRFTVGGGKKVRQKYGDDMPKHCREALRAIGFEEDRGACAVMECAGSFKYQHDTDKDLKFIHVFPKIDTAAAAAAAPNQQDEEEAEIKVAGMTLDELPPEHLCAIVSRDTFSKLYSKQCPSFSQRRALLKALKELAARLAGFEERMTNMQALTAAEEELYNTAQEVPEKVAELEKSMEGMMAGGHLTKAEIDTMVQDLQDKEAQLQGMIASAKEAGKKTDKQEAGLDQLRAKIASLRGMTPAVRKRKEDREILTLWKQLRDLKAIEDSKQLVSLSLSLAVCVCMCVCACVRACVYACYVSERACRTVLSSDFR